MQRWLLLDNLKKHFYPNASKAQPLHIWRGLEEPFPVRAVKSYLWILQQINYCRKVSNHLNRFWCFSLPPTGMQNCVGGLFLFIFDLPLYGQCQSAQFCSTALRPTARGEFVSNRISKLQHQTTVRNLHSGCKIQRGSERGLDWEMTPISPHHTEDIQVDVDLYEEKQKVK